VTKIGCFDAVACENIPHDDTAEPFVPERDVAVTEAVAVGTGVSGRMVRPLKKPIAIGAALLGREDTFVALYKFENENWETRFVFVVTHKLLRETLLEAIIYYVMMFI
jgi:hypothetical protein